MMDKPIRVLINALHAKAGGGVSYLRNMLPLLASDPRLDLHLLIHGDQQPLFAPLPDRLVVHEARFRSTFLGRLIWEQVMLPFRARAIGAEITFSPANFGPLFAPGPVILLRNTVEVAETETRFKMRVYWKVLAWMTRASLARCRRAIAVSGYARDVLAGGRANQVTVIHHGVQKEFSPGPGRRDPARFLLAVGTIYQQKNFHTLLRAFAKARETAPDLTLTIVGAPAPGGEATLDALRRLADALGVAEATTFAGHKSPAELVDLYRRCTAFVFPSTAETFGQPLVEAMACGAPVVCSNTSAMPEVVGEAARQFDPFDADAMAAEITAVVTDPALAQVLSEKSLARARNFSWEETARRTADILVAASGRTVRSAGDQCAVADRRAVGR